MLNTAIMKFKEIKDKYGCLTPIESEMDIPFGIRRVYYISKVDSEVTRGYHSHRKLHQILICVNGSVKIRLKNPCGEEIVELNDSSKGLYIGPLIWREMFDFSDEAVLLVLASEHYDVDDYIRNYDFYLDEANNLFN